MLCPSCQKEMQKGFLKSRYPQLYWQPESEGRRPVFSRKDTILLETALDGADMVRPLGVAAYNCPECRQLIVRYDQAEAGEA